MCEKYSIMQICIKLLPKQPKQKSMCAVPRRNSRHASISHRRAFRKVRQLSPSSATGGFEEYLSRVWTTECGAATNKNRNKAQQQSLFESWACEPPAGHTAVSRRIQQQQLTNEKNSEWNTSTHSDRWPGSTGWPSASSWPPPHCWRLDRHCRGSPRPEFNPTQLGSRLQKKPSVRRWI